MLHRHGKQSNLDDLEDHAGVGLVVGGERLHDHPGLGYPSVAVFERHEPRAVRVVAARSPVPVRLHRLIITISLNLNEISSNRGLFARNSSREEHGHH